MKYLQISIDNGKVLELAEIAKQNILENKKSITIASFENNSDNPNAPQYKSSECVVWEKEKLETNNEVVPN